MPDVDTKQVVSVLNRILEAELAGVVRYTHYSFLVFGYGRIPIVSWLRGQADESLLHAQQTGEWITTLGAYPSLEIGALLDSHQHDIGDMLRESLASEGKALELYRELLGLVEGLAAGELVNLHDDVVGRVLAIGAHDARRGLAARVFVGMQRPHRIAAVCQLLGQRARVDERLRRTLRAARIHGMRRVAHE